MLKVVFVVKFKQFTPCSSVSIVNFEHVIADWEDHLCMQSS